MHLLLRDGRSRRGVATRWRPAKVEFSSQGGLDTQPSTVHTVQRCHRRLAILIAERLAAKTLAG